MSESLSVTKVLLTVASAAGDTRGENADEGDRKRQGAPVFPQRARRDSYDKAQKITGRG